MTDFPVEYDTSPLTEEEREEVFALLKEVGSWLSEEVKKIIDEPGRVAITYPTPGGGDLEGMTLDEALARADALLDHTNERVIAQRARRKRVTTFAWSILDTGLRIISARALPRG